MTFIRAVHDVFRRRYILKIAVAFLFVAVLTMALGAMVYAQTSDTLQADTEADLAAISSIQAEQLDTQIESLRTQVRAMSANPAFESGESEEVDAHIRTLFEDETVPDHVVAIHYLDTERGEIVASSADDASATIGKSPDAPYVTDPPSFEDSGDVTVTAPYRIDGVDEPVVAVVSPVPEESDRALVFVAEIAGLTANFQGFDQQSETIVVDRQGTYVVHPEDGKLLTTDHDATTRMAVDDALAGNTGAVNSEELDVLVGYAPLSSMDWAVLVRVPHAAAFATSSEIGTAVLGMIAVTVLALAAVGVFVSHRTTRPLRRLADRASEITAGDLDAELQTKRIDEIGQLFVAIAQLRDSVRQEIEHAEEAREHAETSRKEAEAAQTEAEAQKMDAEEARERAEQITAHIEGKAEHYESVMTACADGDLTRRVDSDSQSTAMTAIGEAFNTMIAGLEETIGDVKRFGAHVSTAATEADASAVEVMEAGTEVSESVQEISDGAARQNRNLGDVSGQMSGLSASAEEVAATVSDVATQSEQAAEAGQHGQAAAKGAIEEMGAVERQTLETVEEIEELEAEMDTIGDIVEVITGVAEQTNLLALNASIEAAHTGSDGDGFAVVAEEIKRLAEETKESATEIETRIQAIQDQTGQTVVGMAETSARVAEGVETVEETIAAVEQIVDHVEETNIAIQEINNATEDQAESSQKVVEVVDEVATISQETTSMAQSVAAAAEEQTATLSTVSGNAADLTERADQLHDALEDFTVDSDDASEFEFEEEPVAEEDDAFEAPSVADPPTDGDPAASDD